MLSNPIQMTALNPELDRYRWAGREAYMLDPAYQGPTLVKTASGGYRLRLPMHLKVGRITRV